jgi:hypothetical protein
MSDLIRNALHAAARACCYSDGECPCASPNECQKAIGCIEPVRDAVAAFLYELDAANVPLPAPPFATGWSGRGHGEGRLHGVNPRSLAAAVMEALRHE